jgi:hypothetical protein
VPAIIGLRHGNSGGLVQDLVSSSDSIDVPGSASSSDAAPAPESSGTVGPRVSVLSLLSSFVFPPPRIDCRWVGDEAESMCSQVAAVEMLLHKTLASVGWNILHLIQVSLQKGENLACMPLASSILSHPLLCCVSTASILE